MFFLGLLMIIAQVWGTVIVFGGHPEAPKVLKILIGVGQILVLLSFWSYQ